LGVSQGTGLRVTLKVSDYQSKIPTYGDIYPDLFAMVQCVDGLFIYTYNTESNEWNRSTCISKFEAQSQSDEVSVKDSYINSILPNVHVFPVGLYDTDEPEDSLMVVSTASFVNIVDRNKIPFKDSGINKTEVDLTRFYCDRIYTATADSKSFDAVISKIKEQNHDRFDSYIIWRWNNPDLSKPEERDFSYGIIHRSFNNLQSYDNVTFLPDNELNCKNFVNTNASTTMVWDVQDLTTTLLWTFNPTTHIREIYSIDPDTREVHVSRSEMNWDSIKVYTPDFQNEEPIVEYNKLKWNIATNVLPTNWDGVIHAPLYQQPQFRHLLSIGDDITTISDDKKPQGNWQLVFPRIQTLQFTNGTYTYDAKTIHKLNVVKNVNTLDRTDLLDINGNPVNAKTLIINSNDDNTSSIKVYNSQTGKWNNI
jgi:hypothetical protein